MREMDVKTDLPGVDETLEWGRIVSSVGGREEKQRESESVLERCLSGGIVVGQLERKTKPSQKMLMLMLTTLL